MKKKFIVFIFIVLSIFQAHGMKKSAKFYNSGARYLRTMLSSQKKSTFLSLERSIFSSHKSRNYLWYSRFKKRSLKIGTLCVGLGIAYDYYNSKKLPIIADVAKKTSLPKTGNNEKNRSDVSSSECLQLATKMQNDRPSPIQDAINTAFEKNKNADKWYYNGSDYYCLLGIDEDLLFKHLASEHREKEDVYIIDVGCSNGQWGRHAMSILQNEACKKSGKRFHIFSITGGKECDEVVEQKDHVTLYQLNQFKIENIDEEFSKRGFDLKGKVDLIVSRWTLRHLVDPFGTLKRMYRLLTPMQGMLLSNGFLFKFNHSDKIKGFPPGNEHVLAKANSAVLFLEYDVGRDAGHFLLVRNNKKELEIPLEYTGNVHFIGDRYQCESNVVTVFNQEFLIKSNFNREYIGSDRHYCDKDDQQCKDLYNTLTDRGLFYKME